MNVVERCSQTHTDPIQNLSHGLWALKHPQDYPTARDADYAACMNP